MAIIKYTEATVGATACTGVNGSLVAILDVALLLNGWAIEYSSGNGRVYRAGSGNRFRLAVFDDSTVSGDPRACVFRGCENATGATTATIVDPFPLVSQVANNQQFILKSTTANATARNYTIFVAPTWVRIFINSSSTANIWETMRFGDAANTYSGDAYATLCSSRNSTALTTPNTSGYILGNSGLQYFCRSIDGSIKSSVASPNGIVSGGAINNSSGAIGTLKPPLSGYGNTIDGDEISVYDFCNTSSTVGAFPLAKRAWIQNTYAPLHNGSAGVNSRDVWDDGAGRSFEAFAISASSWLFQETTDTWVQP